MLGRPRAKGATDAAILRLRQKVSAWRLSASSSTAAWAASSRSSAQLDRSLAPAIANIIPKGRE